MSNKAELYSDENFTLMAEGAEGNIFLHLSVHNFSKEILRDFRNKFKVVKQEAVSLGIEYLFTVTPNKKFCKLIDSSCKSLEVIEAEGEEFEVMVWDLK